MIAITDLLSYLPSQHGEHGVDATLHMLCHHENGPLHEVFANPPGGSWTQFDIIHPETNFIYRWDHIPRAPTSRVKRPDLVLQLNEGSNISLLSLESKLTINSIEPNIAERLNRYIVGEENITGLKQRPAWHRLRGGETKHEIIEGLIPSQHNWEVIPPDAPESERYWFRDYPDNQTTFWSGFAYALTPEVYSNIDAVRKDLAIRELEQLLRTRPLLDVLIVVGWAGKYHEPFILHRYSERFADTKMAQGLNMHLLGITLE